MPIEGYFGFRTGAPYFSARVTFPRLGIRQDVTFLMDTGADNVLLSVLDAERLKLPYESLNFAPDLSLGVGGAVQDYLEPALLLFSDGISQFVYETDVFISPPSFDYRTPSLLGRAILDNWYIQYRPMRGLLTAEPEFATLVRPQGAGMPPTRNPERD